MLIKEVKAKAIFDSRKEKTIEISVNGHKSSAPTGKSTGKYEAKPYIVNLEHDINFINNLNKKLKNFPNIEKFDDLAKVERVLRKKIGANTLFALESGILKALAKHNKVEVWQLLIDKEKIEKTPYLLSNIVGGGVHTKNIYETKPDFQEFLSIGRFKHNKRAYNKIKNHVFGKFKNDENAWVTFLENEDILKVMKHLGLYIGLDVAASQFFKNNKYCYKNNQEKLTREEQINYMAWLVDKFDIHYLEDALDEEDFNGFKKLREKIKNKCLVVGDDLTVTNYSRVSKAIRMKAINGLIVKPNQTGSLIEVKKIIELCKKHHIVIIMSHRSGETKENILADLAFGFQVDFMKIPIYGKERLAKIKRLKQIVRKLR